MTDATGEKYGVPIDTIEWPTTNESGGDNQRNRGYRGVSNDKSTGNRVPNRQRHPTTEVQEATLTTTDWGENSLAEPGSG